MFYVYICRAVDSVSFAALHVRTLHKYNIALDHVTRKYRYIALDHVTRKYRYIALDHVTRKYRYIALDHVTYMGKYVLYNSK